MGEREEEKGGDTFKALLCFQQATKAHTLKLSLWQTTTNTQITHNKHTMLKNVKLKNTAINMLIITL